MPEDDLIRGVEQFLYREARLLDQRKFHDWLTLFTDDVHYWMASRSNRYPRSSKAISASLCSQHVSATASGTSANPNCRCSP